MSAIDEIRKTIFDINQQLLERPAFFKGSGASIDDPSFDKEIAIFESLQARLSVAIKELQNTARRARLKGGGLPAAGRKEVDDLLAQAQRLQQSLKRTAEANSSVNPLEGMANLWQNQHEYHEANLVMHTEAHGGYIADHAMPAPGEFAGTIESTALFAFTALQAYVRWLKRRKKA